VPPITVYVFGGGHIGMHLVPLCHLVGFRTVVVDDRADFISRDRFPHADDLRAVPSFDRAVDAIPLGVAAYVVIVTRGHGGDEAILRQALRQRPGYIGMIGSSRKRGLMFNQLIADGFTQEDLARVTCPVGLPIGADTPEEIAVSIVAQLVTTRAASAGKGSTWPSVRSLPRSSRRRAFLAAWRLQAPPAIRLNHRHRAGHRHAPRRGRRDDPRRLGLECGIADSGAGSVRCAVGPERTVCGGDVLIGSGRVRSLPPDVAPSSSCPGTCRWCGPPR